MKKVLVGLLIIALVVAGLFIFILDDKADAPDSANISSTPAPAEKEEDFSKNQFSLDDPTSPWVIVNKKRALPAGFIPEDLRTPDVRLRLNPNDEQMKFRRAAEADLKNMFEAAKKDGVELVFGSGYRSEVTQKQFYDSYVAKDGKEAADTYSARPGHSEHQTGLAFDLTTPDGSCHLQVCFADTAGGKWVQAHAHEYGFIIRYINGKEAITGYQYEPWHLRYVGLALAAEIQKTGQTLEEFFGLPAANQY